MKNRTGRNLIRYVVWFLILVLVLVIIISGYLSWSEGRMPSTTEYFTADSEYTIEEIPHFLSQEECNRIIELSVNNLSQSKLFKEGDVEDMSLRRSKQAWLTGQEDPMLVTISQRIAKRTNTDITDQESYQVVKYDKDGFYKPHFDACNLKAGDDCERMNLGKGPRYLTFLMYLNDDFDGGGTFFPELNLTVKPETGKAVIFHNVDIEGHVLPKSMHGGMEVTGGEKWIANKWIHRK
uniref:Fe2OG dioxygenase domain-containing protein n=1 Tax=viral metagenome TaxID=1070528 RepID=A0A6C0IBS2_9ZZZZ